MNMKKIVASVAASAMAISAMALNVSAMVVKTISPIELDNNADKMVQWDIRLFGDFASLDEIVIEGKVSPNDDGWTGGSGGLGFNAKTGWVQIDFELDAAKCDFYTLGEDGSLTVTLDFTNAKILTQGDNSDLAPDVEANDKGEYGILQLGWWWGTSPLSVTDLKVNGTSVMGKSVEEAPAATEPEATEAPAATEPEATEAPAGTDAPTTADPGTDDNKDSANTGVEGVAVVAGLAVLATGAVVISRKRK